jgi:hypothetical protein
MQNSLSSLSQYTAFLVEIELADVRLEDSTLTELGKVDVKNSDEEGGDEGIADGITDDTRTSCTRVGLGVNVMLLG